MFPQIPKEKIPKIFASEGGGGRRQSPLGSYAKRGKIKEEAIIRKKNSKNKRKQKEKPKVPKIWHQRESKERKNKF